jgi:uncharacterized protein
MTDPANNDRRIDYIEIPIKDMAKTKAFYSHVFGWEFTDYGPDYASFHDGRMSGGFDVSDQVKPGGVLIVFYSANLEAALQKVEETGQPVVKPIFPFPGGRRFHFQDPSGHEMAIWSE